MSIFTEKLPVHSNPWHFDNHSKKLKKAYEKDSVPRLAQVADIITPLANKVNETSVLHQFIKIVKHSAEYVIILWDKLAAKQIFLYCSAFSDGIKTLGLVNGIKTVIQNAAVQDLQGIKLHERNIGISYGVFDTISGGFSFINLLDQFQLLGIADLSLSLGSVTLLPLRLVGSGIDLIKNGLEIATGALRIYETHEKKTKFKARKKQFSTKDSGDIAAFLKDHLAEMEQKQTKARDNVKILETKMEDTYKLTDQALKDYNAAKTDHKANRSFSTWRKVHVMESELFKTKKEHDQALKECVELRSKFEARALKWKVWSSLENHHKELLRFHTHAAKKDTDGNLIKFEFEADDPLNRLIEHKREKWNKQISNCSWSTAIDAVGISLNTVVSTTIVASSVLAMSGIGLVPALLTLTSISLFTSFGNLALELLDDYRNPHEIPKTNFDDYKLDPTKHGFSIHPDPNKPVFI